MISSLFKFELRYRLKNALTYLIFVLFFGQGIWYATGVYEHYTGGEVLLNGASIFYLCLAGGGMIVVAVVAMISGTTLYRDIAEGSASYIYACPVDAKRFFLTHFAAAYTINLLLIAAYPLGMLLLKYSGMGETHQFGPNHLPQLVHGYLLFTIPNIFMLTAACFIGLVFARKMVAAYTGVVILTLFFVVGEVMSSNSPHHFFLSVMDPFGYVYTKLTVQILPVAQKNSGFLPLTAAFWVNRLFWLSLTGFGLYRAYVKFSFPYFLTLPVKKCRQSDKEKKEHMVPFTSLSNHQKISSVSCHYDFWANIGKMLRLTKTEFLSVVRPASFRIIFAILVLIVFMQNLFWNSTYYVGHQVPLTSGMCNVRLVNGFLFMVILMMLSSELFFKEKTAGFRQLSGTMPAPVWVLQLPKLFAMFGVAFLFALVIFFGGIFCQVIQGFWQIDLSLYLISIFGYKFGWITYMFNIVLVFFLASLLDNRYLTHIVAIGYYLFMIISFDIGLIEQLRFGYALVPGLEDYSEIVGYGIWNGSSFWLFLAWLALALFLVLAAIQLFKRGSGMKTFSRKRFLQGELSLRGRAVALAALLIFFWLQGYIVKNSTELRNYIPSDQADFEAAQYEKEFNHSAVSNQFIEELHELRVDFYPGKRRAEYTTALTLTNLSGEKVEKLYFNIDAHSHIKTVTQEHVPLKRLQKNIPLGMWVYALDMPLQPGAKASFSIEAVRQYQGFPQTSDQSQADLAANGLFLTKAIPVIGFAEEKTLQNNRDRVSFQLPKLASRMASVNNITALNKGFVSSLRRPMSAEKRAVNITVSTTAEQYPFAPGRLIRRWSEEGRNYAFSQITTPTIVQPYPGSANYLRENTVLGRVDVDFLYHPQHTYNLKEFKEALSAGLSFIESELGEYPYGRITVAEIPYYHEESYAMAGLIALSEKEGWYADCSVPEIRGYIQYVLARDLIRQWLAANGFVGDVQGADMLWTALPSSLALQVVQSRLGREQVEQLFVKMRKEYQKERTNEPNQEPPLLQADDVAYLESNKGVIALYKLAESIGFDTFNKEVSHFIGGGSKSLVFKNFYTHIKDKYAIESGVCKLFEQVEDKVDL